MIVWGHIIVNWKVSVCRLHKLSFNL